MGQGQLDGCVVEECAQTPASQGTFLGRAGGEGAPPEGHRGAGLCQMRKALQPGERRTGTRKWA